MNKFQKTIAKLWMEWNGIKLIHVSISYSLSHNILVPSSFWSNLISFQQKKSYVSVEICTIFF